MDRAHARSLADRVEPPAPVASRSAAVPPLVSAITHLLTAGAAAAFVVVAGVDPAGFEDLVRRDYEEIGAGLVETLTPLVLLPGIGAALYAAFLRRERFSPLVRSWLVAWSFACVYFAGEEVSWGQWHFGWTTPEWFAAINDQGETNLHNVSSWFDQKPRILVESFIVGAGLFAPLVRRRALPRWPLRDPPLEWILAPSMCVSAAAFFALVRVATWIDAPPFDVLRSSELRELTIAWFLALYLVSYPLRLAPGADEASPSGA